MHDVYWDIWRNQLATNLLVVVKVAEALVKVEESSSAFEAEES